MPLLPEVADYLHQVYLAKGVLATTAIEGNTLSEKEVLARIEGKLNLPPSREYLGQEIDNIIEACNLIGNKIIKGKSAVLNRSDIEEFNNLVLKKLPLDEDVVPGEIRTHRVVVGQYRGAPHQDCEYLLDKLCDWLNTFEVPDTTLQIGFGILKAIFAHLYLAWIHPFGDGNGRTARLVEFQILLSVGIPSSVAQILSNHYNQTRSEYYRQLDAASKSGRNVIPFIEYALRGFVDGLDEQLELIKIQQLHVHWKNYVHDSFKNKDSVSEIRQRRVVLDLSEFSEPVPIKEIRHISTRLAEAYARKSLKTIQRDINKLVEMDLVKKTKDGIRVKRELMLAFLPGVRSNG